MATQQYDRRAFLRRGAQAAAVAATAGVAGTLLDACGSSTTGNTTSTTLKAHGQTNHGKPTRGGTMTIGTWSEANGLSPPTATWDETGYLYGNAIFDTLVQIGADGKAHPYLAAEFTHDPDYMTWTFTLRPGITFHDGEPLNAKAVVGSLNAVKSGLVTSQTLKPVVSITDTNDMTVTIKVDQPWPAFPTYLTNQLGYICSPKMLASANQGATKPIGTGSFLFESWVPNSHLNLKRNPGYWQTGYPYLDALNFKPILDNTTRAEALEAGTVNLMHCQAPQTIKPFFSNSKYQVITTKLPAQAEPTVDFIMLNTAVEPLNDLTLRQALGMAIDRELLRESFGADLTQLVNGPFQPGEIWYGKTGYPGFDPAQAKKLVAEYVKKTGKTPSIELTTIQGPDYLAIAESVQANWQAAGVTTSVSQVEFSQFVDDAVLGRFQACTFEQFGATDPDQNYIWWSSETVGPVGGVSLNMARNSDPRIQSALTTGRQSTDIHTRADAYQQVSKYLAEDLPYLWLAATYWAAIAQSNIVGVTGQTLPGGEKGIGFNEGAFLVHQLAYTK